eukprot:CAMPEP_0181477054 /NCGR_PEP_ID=MMETSP1110-20121109/42020_1 /TAXON_ID=174948 /ORGANISM="Symbiodinium sp., Strain CCMP421" /LENGTH=369 /DNA_ID=CAMNT_0023602347 /DNA_START=76 /DNA_END=1185 /DNA_ORIENTATION=-
MAEISSDVEGLLQHEPQRGWWTARGLVASAVASSALMAVGAVSFLHGSGLRTTNNFLQLQESGCLMQGMFYAQPHKMPGTDRTEEASAEACQQRCANMEGCAHFTFWPDGGCLLTDEGSIPKPLPAKYFATVYGPKDCTLPVDAIDTASGAASSGLQQASVAAGDAADAVHSGLQEVGDAATSGLQQAGDAVSSGLQQASDSLSSEVGDAASNNLQQASDTVSSGLQQMAGFAKLNGQEAQSTWGAGVETAAGEVQSGIQGAVDAAQAAVPALPGINGTICSKYPACVAVGLTEGECCPNTDKVSLSCCSGPALVLEVKIPGPLSECAMYPACVALKIQGACCPTLEGTRLGCCDEGDVKPLEKEAAEE